MKNRIMHPDGRIEDSDKMFCHAVLHEGSMKDWNDIDSFPNYLPITTCYPKPDEGPCAHGYEVRTPKFIAIYDTELPTIWLANQKKIDTMTTERARKLGLAQSPGVHVPTPECPNCHGLRVDNEQYTCRTCNGTGRMP